MKDGCFVTFGGYVNGSRVDDVIKFNIAGQVACEHLAGEEKGTKGGPSCRASVSAGAYDSKIYVFGGQEDDNKKMNDMWRYDLQSNAWSQIQQPDDGYKPTPRSGHSSVVYGDKMYIFGGILELTKELNDLVVFDFNTSKISSNSDQDEDLNATNANV